MIFFKLIGFRNLVWIALAQLILHFGFLKQQGFSLALDDWHFLLLVLSSVCIAGE